MSRYRVREKAPHRVRAALKEHPELVADLLHARGIAEPTEAAAFLAPDFLAHSHDPFLLLDMDAAVERVMRAARDTEKVVVWSDYDCDGIPGGVMLSQFLRELGCSVEHYIPHRHEEGYGLNEAGLAELAGKGVTLILTVDLGTTDRAPVAFAREKGIDVIITDHHLPSGELPEALVLNPKRGGYPFAHLCGSGVAWKLVQAILSKYRPEGYPEGREKWLLDLVGLATLSDRVPLIGENRMLAHFGLEVLRRARRPGLKALLKLLRIIPRTLTEDDVGFMLAPRINAASRMDTPATAAELLRAETEEEGRRLALALNHVNDARKGVVASTVKEVRKRLAERSLEAPQSIIVMGNPSWRPGVLGLVASSLSESENVPVCLWGREGGEIVRGSCRSPGSVNVVSLMEEMGDLLEHFGGHALSGGFSMEERRVHELSGRFASAYEKLRGELEVPEVLIDRELHVEEAGAESLRQVRRLAPFGEGNAKPLFVFPNASVENVRTFGKENNHLELRLSHGESRISGIAFFSSLESFEKVPRQGLRADIVGHLEADWGGRPRIRVVDIL